MHNNKINNLYFKKYSPQLKIKLSFFFEYPMARRTICSPSETSNEIISIKKHFLSPHMQK